MNKTIIAIDPGTTESAFVRWDGGHLYEKGTVPNEQMLDIVGMVASTHTVVIEQIRSYGMAVGAETFDTVFWSGRFAQQAIERGGKFEQLPRLDVKMHLCHTTKAKDGNIRQALIDRFGAPGTKKNPNPVTYGLASHMWAAMALAVTYCDKMQANSP